MDLSRRSFLKSSAAAATLVSASSALPQEVGGAHASAWPENGVLLPDTGWTLWLDREAKWKDDALFLPDDVRLAELPVNPPTRGWAWIERLQQAGAVHANPDPASGPITVTLPSTVEQHFWGAGGTRPYTPEEYRYAADDPIPQNGAYFGVSWWTRTIDIPKDWSGKRIFLHIRAAHLRAEVYLNRKLVGYSILEELPFECDLTSAANPGGVNHLAIRITNPFGRFDWVDGLNAQWGAVKLYRSHGFGGLDRGMTMSAHDSIRIIDTFALNRPEQAELAVTVRVETFHPRRDTKIDVNFSYELAQRSTGKVVTKQNAGSIGGNTEGLRIGGAVPHPEDWLNSLSISQGEHTFAVKIEAPELWSLDQPHLYDLHITVTNIDGHTDTRTIPVAFRTFAPEGVGTNGLFRLNGRRIRLYSAISWGYWGLNGMFPTPELAEKEVTQAKKLNLNCLNFHRNLAKEDVLRAHDTLGLLRYLEPGAGKLAIGKLPSGVAANSAGIVMEKATAPDDIFAQRYMFERCVRMVRAFRSHPSVIQYTLQNEIGADLNNPDTLKILEAMRAEDPSRSIVLNDGFVAPPRKAAQAWFEPWNDKLHRSDREEWGGWWNQHQGAGDQWYDEFYKSPTNFTYRSPERKPISEFGEMEGCAVPDNHSLMLHQYADPSATGIGHQPPNQSYDLADHRQIEAATSAFLERWGFRKAFPANEHLWLSLGKKSYDTWQNYLENARISDDLDFAVISGWESTSIENHSGIVDNLRNFKSDPKPIAETLQPIRPCAKQHSLCIELGEQASFDLYLLNDSGRPASGELRFSAVTPSGKLLELSTFPAPAQTPDTFSYLIRQQFFSPHLVEEGMYRFRLALSSVPAATQTKEIWVTRRTRPANDRLRVAVSNVTAALRQQLGSLGMLTLNDFNPDQTFDVIVTSGHTATSSGPQDAGDTTGLEAPPSASKVAGRKLEPGEEAGALGAGSLASGVLEAVRAGTPLLAMPQANSLSDGVARQLADAGAFTYSGNIGDFRAPWMGNWYFVREHPLYAGLPVNQAMGIHYQVKGRQSNGLKVEGPNVEIVAAYSRDHERAIGAGTFTARLGAGRIVYHRVPAMHPVFEKRFLANALAWLTT